jgi:hypothetical protein
MNHAVNWEAISAIGQIVGAIAVVISLIWRGKSTAMLALRDELRCVRRWTPSIGLLNRSQGMRI